MEAIIPKMTPFTYAPQTHHDIPAKNRLHSNMKKIGIEKSALCPCGLEAQTTAHVLQSCPLHKGESTWPTESSLGNRLLGTATYLRLTVWFIALTGLQI